MGSFTFLFSRLPSRTKEQTKLELAVDMVCSVILEPTPYEQVILLCNSWYPKKPEFFRLFLCTTEPKGIVVHPEK